MSTNDSGAAFKLVGGRLCLDFLNTVSGREANPRPGGLDYRDSIERERLVDYADLVRWAVTAGATSKAAAGALERAGRAAPAAAAKVVVRARHVREAIYRIFKAAIEGWTPPADDMALFNAELAKARQHEHLVFQGKRFDLDWEASPALDAALGPVVRSAAELLTAEALPRVTQCPGEDCGWMFLDTSRNGSRRWCDMADCGNLAKVRRFRGRN